MHSTNALKDLETFVKDIDKTILCADIVYSYYEGSNARKRIKESIKLPINADYYQRTAFECMLSDIDFKKNVTIDGFEHYDRELEGTIWFTDGSIAQRFDNWPNQGYWRVLEPLPAIPSYLK
tara:strand:+ start:283 stop:648 length:366 start_codon:yes stop_codon:yes gene_type:complete